MKSCHFKYGDRDDVTTNVELLCSRYSTEHCDYLLNDCFVAYSLPWLCASTDMTDGTVFLSGWESFVQGLR